MKRFWRKVAKGPSCWEWRGCIRDNGYGSFSIGKKTYLSHRMAYELVKGLIPQGLELDHLCRNRSCVNPDHLEAVTHQENMSRGTHAIKTHCIQGHEFTSENTYFRLDRPGNRKCKTCNRQSIKKSYYKKRKLVI